MKCLAKTFTKVFRIVFPLGQGNRYELIKKKGNPFCLNE
jgi:hypothetical protein